MKYKKISIKLTEEQYKLFNAYQLHCLEEYGMNKSKQQIVMELLFPILKEVQESYSFGGSK